MLCRMPGHCSTNYARACAGWVSRSGPMRRTWAGCAKQGSGSLGFGSEPDPDRPQGGLLQVAGRLGLKGVLAIGPLDREEDLQTDLTLVLGLPRLTRAHACALQ